MAVDETVLDGVREGTSPPTLRFYTWAPGCVSIGRFQPAADLADSARKEPGVDWVRRPSGGRALYHGPELTYSMLAPVSDVRVAGGVLESYRRIAAALQAGLEILGVGTQLADACGAATASRDRSPSCFTDPSAHELLWAGRKLVGSAQLRRRGALLQHGSILLDSPVEKLFLALRFDSTDERERARLWEAGRTATVSEALGRPVEVGEVMAALVRGFQECWGLELRVGGLTAREESEASRLEAGKYRSLEWSYRIAGSKTNRAARATYSQAAQERQDPDPVIPSSAWPSANR